jgi:hypothetical protein
MSKPAEKPPGEKKTDSAPAGGGKAAKGASGVAGACLSWGCKHDATRFNFCSEHYDHFKFGLIKKTGEPVSDYDKKFGHYQAHKAKKGDQRVA